MISLPLATSSTRTTRLQAVARDLLSGLKARAPSVSVVLRTSLPLGSSQTLNRFSGAPRVLPFASALARYLPSGLKATRSTLLACPSMVRTSLPPATSHNLTVLSEDELASCFPAAPSPQAPPLFRGRASHFLSRRAKAHAGRRAVVSGGRPGPPGRGQLPRLHGVVAGRARRQFAVGAEGQPPGKTWVPRDGPA